MQREVERFIAEEPNGNCYIVSCFQEFTRTDREDGASLLPGSKYFRTCDGVFLKAIDEFTFNILGSGRLLYKRDKKNQDLP